MVGQLSVTDLAKLCQDTMIQTLISSETRIKLLLKFFLNPKNKAYLRGLEQELSSNTNAIRLELNRFIKANMLLSSAIGNKRYYQVNEKHPLFPELRSIVLKYVGIDKLINSITSSLGDVDGIFLIGDYANGRDTGVVDVALLGAEIDVKYLVKIIGRIENLIGRKVRYIIFDDQPKLNEFLNDQNFLVLWQKK